MPPMVGIGIVGAGSFTQARLLPNLQRLPGVEVVAICSRTSERVSEVARAFHIPIATTDRREVLTRSDVEAVLVATHPDSHCEIVSEALEAGKHVLCQTRMAVD